MADDTIDRAEGDVALEVYREAFRAIDTPSLIADTDFVITDINTGGLEFTGYTYDEIVGEPVPIISGDDATYGEILEAVIHGDSWSGDFSVRTKNDEVVFGNGSAAPIIVDDETRGYVAVFIDTTKQRRYENTAEVLGRLLRHDLRNDLNVLYGYVQQAELGLDDGAASQADLTSAKGTIVEIINKTERARDLRKLLERTYEAANQPVRLDFVLNDVLVGMLNEHDAEFRFETFPGVWVIADNLLTTALESVIENAIIHNDTDRPTVEVSVEEHETSVVITISDNGPGIPEGQEDMIFGREELDQLHHGRGISLFFADNVIRSYNGDIWVENDESSGATFRIRLNKK